MNTFENWYTNILEEVATSPAKSLAGDVDTIINSLDTLVKELTEDLDSPEFNEVNEADAEGPSKVMQWMWWMPKARKAQQKVNKIKMNVTDMEAAAEDAPDKDQRAKISAKAKIASDQAGELQRMVDDKFASKGELTKRALSSEKIAGKIALIKRATGLEDNPEKVASYKEKMAELQQKYKADIEALKELEPSEKDKQAEKNRLEQKKADDAKAQKKIDTEDNTSKKDSTESGDDSTKTEPTIDPKVAEAKKKIKEYQDAIDTLNSKDKKTKNDEDKISMLKAAIASQQKTVDSAEQKESLVNRANTVGLNELASEIGSKFDWQVSEGTLLYQQYNTIIKKAEYSNSLNESRYQNLSIKDNFSRLL